MDLISVKGKITSDIIFFVFAIFPAEWQVRFLLVVPSFLVSFCPVGN